MSDQTQAAARNAVAAQVAEGLDWSDRYRRRWGRATNAARVIIVFCSASAGIIVGFTDEVPDLRYLVAALVWLSAIMLGLRDALDFEGKWINYRETRTALEFMDMDLKDSSVDYRQIRKELERVYLKHNKAFAGRPRPTKGATTVATGN